MKNAFFWCIICWCRSKIAKFWNFAHFLAIFSTFSIFAFFLWFVEKKFWKRLKSVGNDPKLCGNMIFDLFVAPEQRKMGGAPGALPCPWQGLSDVALRRVKRKSVVGGWKMIQILWMALIYHKWKTFQRFSKLKMLETWFTFSLQKKVKIKLVRPLRNLQKTTKLI